MHAERQHDGSIIVSGKSRIEEFDRIWAGVGWPDDEPGYLCVVGQRSDRRLHCMWEARGGLWELADAAVESKDRFLIDCVWVDARDAVATAYLRNFNGLSYYEKCVAEASGKGGHMGPPLQNEIRVAVEASGPSSRLPTERPYFRSKDTVAAVVPVPERTTSNFRSALEKVRETIVNGRLLIHPTNCPRLMYTLKQPLDELLKSPVMKGLVWVMSAQEGAGTGGWQAHGIPEPWYDNLPRGGR